MDLAICVVGINQWKEYTRPCLLSIKREEPEARMVLIDNSSYPPYPGTESVHLLRTERICYSAAINAGFRAAGKADWYLSLNNDTLCMGPFMELVEGLSGDAVYGRQIITEQGLTWFGNWLVLIPLRVWEEVGEFDENFKMCGFEDADYSARAKTLGFETKHIELPFIHFWGKTRWSLPFYGKTRAGNIDYFERKHGYRLGSSMVVTHG